MDNEVELIGYYGGDETHALSAWTSTKRELSSEKRGRMDAMLNALARDGHHTPFEKSYLHFLVTCETASHIHAIKHRIGVSVNAESARYKELKEDRFYIPDDLPYVVKNEISNKVAECFETYHWALEKCKEFGMDRKRAKEACRMVLPYANQLTLDVGFNFRSFIHFQELRNDEHAQDEIHRIAEEMRRLVQETGQFDLSLRAFNLYRG